MPAKKFLGFTLVELMIAVTIVGIISAIGMLSFAQIQKTGRDARRKQDLRSIQVALEIYYQKNKRYPVVGAASPSINLSSTGGNWINDAGSAPAIPLDSNYIIPMPIDPTNTGNYTYTYFNWSNGWGSTCVGSKFYVLYAKLENSNDKDAYNPANSICGPTVVNIPWLIGYFVLYSTP